MFDLANIFKQYQGMTDNIRKTNPYLANQYQPMQQAPQRQMQQPMPQKLDNLGGGAECKSGMPGCGMLQNLFGGGGIPLFNMHPANLLMDKLNIGMNNRGMPPPMRGIMSLFDLFRK